MDVQTILSQVDLGAIALPEFQRGYVWNREQVRGLMTSLYRRYPVGSLMVWVTPVEGAQARHGTPLNAGTVELLLDGQQRVTTLYGIIKGEPPRFFDGDRNAFTGLHFDIDDEAFEFYAPAKMKGNPRWTDVSSLMTQDVGQAIARVFATPELTYPGWMQVTSRTCERLVMDEYARYGNDVDRRIAWGKRAAPEFRHVEAEFAGSVAPTARVELARRWYRTSMGMFALAADAWAEGDVDEAVAFGNSAVDAWDRAVDAVDAMR